MNRPQLNYRDKAYEVLTLTEFGFDAKLPESVEPPAAGVLKFDEKSIDIQFRVRSRRDDISHCSFVDLSLTHAAIIKKFYADQERGFVPSSSLEGKTYDELAAGIVDDKPSDESSASEEAKPVGAGSKTKVIALMSILLIMVGLMLGSFFFLRSRSLLEINNSSLTGNYVAVNSPYDGQISEIMVREGEFVSENEVLFRLKNPELTMQRDEFAAQLEAAEVRVRALKQQHAGYQKKIDTTRERLTFAVRLAEAQLKTTKSQMDVAKTTFRRLNRYSGTGAVTAGELDVARKQMMVAEADINAANNALKFRQFALDVASKEAVVFIGDRIDTEPDRLVAEIEIAEAEVKTLRLQHKNAEQRIEGLAVRAPRSGRVHVNYNHAGQFVRAADQVIALGVDNDVWAAGHVSTEQAKRVQPGLAVTIRVPATGRSFDGIVNAVGHRSLYSKGGYTADFRSAVATDVPVKVTIAELPEELPPGMRLEMVIRTGFGVEWLDRMLGYEGPVAASDRNKKTDTATTKTDSHPEDAALAKTH